MNRAIGGLAAASILFLGAAVVGLAQTSPAAIVKERHEGMEKMWSEHLRDVAQTIRSDKPDLALVATKTSGAMAQWEKLGSLFPPGTGRDVVPATRAKPEIWTQRGEFDAAYGALRDALKTLADDAKKGDAAKAKADWGEVAKACGGCHGGPVKAGGKFRFEKES